MQEEEQEGSQEFLGEEYVAIEDGEVAGGIVVADLDGEEGVIWLDK